MRPLHSDYSPAHRVARELEAAGTLVESISYGHSSPSMCMPAEATLYLTDGTVATLSDTSCVDDIGFSAHVIRGGSVRNGTLTMRYKQPVLGDAFDDVVTEVKDTIVGAIPA